MTLFLPSILVSQNEVVDISGYFFTSSGVLYLTETDVSTDTFYLGRSTLRLNFVTKNTEFAKLDLSVDFNIFYGVYNNFFPLWTNVIKLNDETVFTIDIRKLYLMVKYGILDFYSGRQLVKFGEGYIFNPLNMFSKIDFADINFTRIGIDALRAKIQVSDTGYFENVFIPKTNLQENEFATRLGFTLVGWDVSTVGYYRKKFDWLSLGFSFKGDIVLGLYGEFLYNYTKNENKRCYSYMFGTDYSLKEKFVFRVEYTHNSFNINNFAQEEILFLPNYPFISQQYVVIQFNFLYSLIDNINLSYVTNLQTNANFLVLSYQRNLLHSVNLSTTLRYTNKNFSSIPTLLNFDAICCLVDINMRY